MARWVIAVSIIPAIWSFAGCGSKGSLGESSGQDAVDAETAKDIFADIPPDPASDSKPDDLPIPVEPVQDIPVYDPGSDEDIVQPEDLPPDFPGEDLVVPEPDEPTPPEDIPADGQPILDVDEAVTPEEPAIDAPECEPVLAEPDEPVLVEDIPADEPTCAEEEVTASEEASDPAGEEIGPDSVEFMEIDNGGGPPSCKPCLGDCNGDPADGDETHLNHDPDHCGACGNQCVVAHGLAACEEGACRVGRCDPGWDDQNGEYPDGCEACKPILDGKTEIPDDGEDNDCTSGDSVNDESRGFYVDGGFQFGPACAAPGLGTRTCPFKSLPVAIEKAQSGQDWTDPSKARREMYVAKGEYAETGTVADISKPLVLAGGYEREPSGPWARDIVSNVTVLKSASGAAVKAGAGISGWAAVDGFTVTPQISVAGKLAVRRISSSAEKQPLEIVSGSSGAVLWLAQSKVSGDIKDVLSTEGWVLVQNQIGGKVDSCCESAEWALIDNVIDGYVWAKQAWTFEGNVVKGWLNCIFDCVVRGNTIGGLTDLSVGALVEDNVLLGGVGLNGGTIATRNFIYKSIHCDAMGTSTIAYNVIHGQISIDCIWDIVHNTIYVPVVPTDMAIKLGDSGGRFINNLVVWNGDKGKTYFGLKEKYGPGMSDPAVVRNNAFVGFGLPNGVIYLDDASDPITDVNALNELADLPPCGRGGNVAIDSIEDAKLLSLDPGSPLFMVPAQDSPLVDKGLVLPLECEGSNTAGLPSDFGHNPVPCGGGPDVGAWETRGK